MTVASVLPLPFPVGTAQNDTQNAASIGRLYAAGGKIYRLVKAGADIATAANKVLVTALSSGTPTWVVNTSTTANDSLAVGLVPTGQTGTGATSTTLYSGDYFLIQVSGDAKGISAATVALGALVGCSTTAGKIDDASVTAGVGAIGVCTKAATAADQTIDVILKGLH